MGIGLGTVVGALAGAGIGFLVGGPVGGVAGAAAAAGGTAAAVSGALIGSVVGAAYDFARGLIPSIDTPGNLQGRQVPNATLQTNISQLGNVKPIGYGEFRCWPPLAAPSWRTYVGNQEQVHFYGTVGLGQYRPLEVLVGSVPLASVASFQLDWLAPGEPLRQFRPHVYTSPEVQGEELRGGGLERVTVSDTIGFASNRITLAGQFGNARVGGVVVVSGGTSNDGTYEITARDTDYIDTDGSFVTETVAATVDYDDFIYTVKTRLVNDLDLIFDDVKSEIRITDDPEDVDEDNTFANMQRGDLIVPDGCGANDDIDFVVEEVSPDGFRLIVSTAGTMTAGTFSDADLRLLRRWGTAQYACKPGDTVDEVEIDIEWRNGLVWLDDSGDQTDRTAYVLARYREVDDYGVPLSDWVEFPRISETAASITAQRRSYRYTLPSAMRVQVQPGRGRVESDKNNPRDTMSWTGLKGFVVPREGDNPEVDADATRVALTILTSPAYAKIASEKINIRARRILEAWDGAAWVETETRSPAWALADWLEYQTKAIYSRDSIPIADLVAFDAWCTANGVTYDEYISQAVIAKQQWDAMAQVGRAFITHDHSSGGLKLYQDIARDPVGMIVNARNGRIGPLPFTPSSDTTPSGVIAEFTDPVTWQVREGEDGAIAGDPDTAMVVRLPGCSDWDTAWRFAQYRWAELRYRVEQTSAQSDIRMEGVQRGDKLLFVDPRFAWGDGDEILNISGRTVTVTNGLLLPEASISARLYRSGSTLGAWITCTATSSTTLELDDDPDVTDATHVAIGWAGHWPAEVIMTDRTPGGASGLDFNGVVDDSRVLDDPGTPPEDRYAPSGDPPDMEIAGLSASNDDGTISVEWDAVAAAVLYEVAYRRVGEWEWIVSGRPRTTSWEFDVTLTAEYEIRVRSFSDGGRIGEARGSVVVDFGDAEALNITADPTSADKSTSKPTDSTPQVTFSVCCGTPPYSVEIELVDVVGGSATLTTFGGGLRASVSGPQGVSGTIRATVTDDAETTDTVDVPFSITGY